MPEKEWEIAFGEFALIVRRETKGGETLNFAVVLLAFVGGRWVDVTRYDTAHGYAHRDVLGFNEGFAG